MDTEAVVVVQDKVEIKNFISIGGATVSAVFDLTGCPNDLRDSILNFIIRSQLHA